jgi:DNA-binding MarR family transcriptional regulator
MYPSPARAAGTPPATPIERAEHTDDGSMPANRSLSQQMVRYQRLLHLMKVQVTSCSPDALEWGCMPLLSVLILTGPQRQRQLAECSLFDPSTVSRRVALLVQHGYVERRPDPGDGRAILLAATPLGEELYQRTRARYEEAMAHVLRSWNEGDVHLLGTLLQRFNDDIEAALPNLADHFRKENV